MPTNVPAFHTQRDIIEDSLRAIEFANGARVDFHAGEARWCVRARGRRSGKKNGPIWSTSPMTSGCVSKRRPLIERTRPAAQVRDLKTGGRAFNDRVLAGDARVGENHVHVAHDDRKQTRSASERHHPHFAAAHEHLRPANGRSVVCVAAGFAFGDSQVGRRRPAKAEIDLHRTDVEPVTGLEWGADIGGKRRAVDLRAPAAAEVFEGAQAVVVPIEAAVAARNFRDA